MSNNVLVELSDALADAAEKAGKATVLVNARRRMPASGIIYASDLVLTADHVVESEDGIKVTLADGAEVSARLAGAMQVPIWRFSNLNARWRTLPKRQKARRAWGSLPWCWDEPSANGIEASLGTVGAIGGPIRTGEAGCWKNISAQTAFPIPGFPVVRWLPRMGQSWE